MFQRWQSYGTFQPCDWLHLRWPILYDMHLQSISAQAYRLDQIKSINYVEMRQKMTLKLLSICRQYHGNILSIFIPFQCLHVNCITSEAPRGCNKSSVCSGQLLPSGLAVAPMQHTSALLCLHSSALLRDKQREASQPARKPTVNTFFVRQQEEKVHMFSRSPDRHILNTPV